MTAKGHLSRTLEHRFKDKEKVTNAVIDSDDNSLGVLSSPVMHVGGNVTVRALGPASRSCWRSKEDSLT